MSTPTPTDPREEKKPKVFLVTMRARKNDGATETVSFRSGIFACESEAHAKVAMLEGREPEFSIDELDAKPFDTSFITAPLQSANSKLAAEIAGLKEEIKDTEEHFRIITQDQTNHAIELGRIITTLRAELEAARKERESDDKTILRLIEERNTALAAKDAAEKRLSEVAKAWKNGGGFALAEACRALTPAPTQEPPAGKLPIGTKIRFLKTLDAAANDEHPDMTYAYKGEMGEITGHEAREGYFVKADRWPTPFGASLGDEFEAIPPAGGVTISNETVGIIPTATTPTEASPDVSALGAEAASHPISTEKKGGDEPCYRKTQSSTSPVSNSPADVPSEGRGELLPFNLADALAGKPVVTRAGLPAKKFRRRKLGFGVYSYQALVDGTWCSYTAEGAWSTTKESSIDLFMLPPEGSGA